MINSYSSEVIEKKSTYTHKLNPSSGAAMEIDVRVVHALPYGDASKTRRRALWDDIKKDYFVNLLCRYVSHTPKRNSWNRETWEKIREEMKERFVESNFSTEQLKQLERDLKKLYKSIKHIELQSGFRWDDDNKMLEASDDDWQKLFKADPKARKWHSKMLPYYSGLDTLYKGYHNEEVELTRGLGSSAYISTGANEEKCENVRPRNSRFEDVTFHDLSIINPNHCDNSGSSLNLSLSQNQDQQADFQNLNLLCDASTRSTPMVPILDDSLMTIQNEVTLFRKRASPEHREFEVERKMKNPNDDAIYNFSISQCISKYHELSGFQQSDLLNIVEIFRNAQNREIFLSLCHSERGFWLKSIITKREQASSRKLKRPMGFMDSGCKCVRENSSLTDMRSKWGDG